MAVKGHQMRMGTISGWYVWTAIVIVLILDAIQQVIGQAPERRYACWGSFGPPVVSAQCPRNTVIQVLRAGLKVQNHGGLCAYNENDCGCEYGQTGCQMQDVRQLCMGQPACRLDVTQQYISTPTCKGFSDYMYIEFNCVQVQHNSVSEICSSERTTSEHGFLRSPNYPSLTRARRECDCTLTTDDGSSIELTVLDIQTSDYKCETDKLQVAYDGRTDTYCGQQADSVNKRIASKSSVVSVKFNTDGQGEGGSFWLKYQAEPKADVKLMCTYTETETPAPTTLNAISESTSRYTTKKDSKTTEMERPSPKFYKPMEKKMKEDAFKKKKETVKGKKPKTKKPWWWKYLQNPNSTKPFYRPDKKRTTKPLLLDSVKSLKGRPQYQEAIPQTKPPLLTTTRSGVTAVNHNGYPHQLHQFVQTNKGKSTNIRGHRPPNNQHLQHRQKFTSNSFVDKNGRRWSHLPKSLLNKLQFPVPLIKALEKELTPDKKGNKPSALSPGSSSFSSSSSSSTYRPLSNRPNPNPPKSIIAYPPPESKKFSASLYYPNRQKLLKPKENVKSSKMISKFPKRSSKIRPAPPLYRARPYPMGQVMQGQSPPQTPHKDLTEQLPTAKTTEETVHYLQKLTHFDRKTEGIKQWPAFNWDRSLMSSGSEKSSKSKKLSKASATLKPPTPVPIKTLRTTSMNSTIGVTPKPSLHTASKATERRSVSDKIPKPTPSYIKVSEPSNTDRNAGKRKSNDDVNGKGKSDSKRIRYKTPMSKEARLGGDSDWEEPLDYPFDKPERKPYPKIKESFKRRSYRRRRKYKKKVRKYDYDEDDDYDERDGRKNRKFEKVKKRKYKVRRVWKERPDKTRVSVVRPEPRMYVDVNKSKKKVEKYKSEEEQDKENYELDYDGGIVATSTTTTTSTPGTSPPQETTVIMASTKMTLLKDSVHSDDVVVEELAGKIESVSDFYTALDEEDWTQWPAFEMVKTAQEEHSKGNDAHSSTRTMTNSKPTTKPSPTPTPPKPVPKVWVKPRKHSDPKHHKMRTPKPRPKSLRVRPTPPHTVQTAQPDLLANSLSIGNSIQQGPKTRPKVSSASNKPRNRKPRRKPAHTDPTDHVPSKSESLTNPRDNTVTIIAACVVCSILVVIVVGIVIRFVVNRKQDGDCEVQTPKAKRYIHPETTYPGQHIPRPKRI